MQLKKKVNSVCNVTLANINSKETRDIAILQKWISAALIFQGIHSATNIYHSVYFYN